MSVTNSSLTTTFGRNSSYPTHESLAVSLNNQSGVFNGRRCSSTTAIPPPPIDQYSKVNSQTLDRHIELNLNNNSSTWIERCKQRVTDIFKQISKPTTKQGK